LFFIYLIIFASLELTFNLRLNNAKYHAAISSPHGFTLIEQLTPTTGPVFVGLYIKHGLRIRGKLAL